MPLDNPAVGPTPGVKVIEEGLPNPQAKAFAKVKVRGGGLPERRSDLVRRISHSLAPGSPVTGATTPVSDERAELDERDGERKPLLSRSRSEA